jgi:transcriptional regulator with XRE-family HTH domain
MESGTSKRLGKYIREYRKASGMSLDSLGREVNKSKATICKYENGSTSIDVETLEDIAHALNIDMGHLVAMAQAIPDAEGINMELSSLCEGKKSYFLYFYDGAADRLSKSIILLSPAESQARYNASLFYAVDDFCEPGKCKVLYLGTAHTAENYINFIFKNTKNAAESVFLIAKEPFLKGEALNGIITGISFKYLQPISFHVLLSEQIINDEKKLTESLKIHKKELSNIQHVNGLMFMEDGF